MYPIRLKHPLYIIGCFYLYFIIICLLFRNSFPTMIRNQEIFPFFLCQLCIYGGGIILTFMFKPETSKKLLQFPKNISNLNKYILIVLLCIYIAYFFIKQDFTIAGWYSAISTLFLVALSEEFLFRGFLYKELCIIKTPSNAAFISSALFVGMHLLQPLIFDTASLSLNIMLFSKLIVLFSMSYAFIYIYHRSHTLWIPILCHACIDYLPPFHPFKHWLLDSIAYNCCLCL